MDETMGYVISSHSIDRPSLVLLNLGVGGSFFRVLLRKFFGRFEKLFLVAREFFGEIGSKWMIGLWVIDQGHEALDNLIGLSRRLPVLRRNNRQADLALFIDVWMVDLCFERNFWRFEGVLGRKYDFDSKCSLVVRRVVRNDKALPTENV